MRARILIFCLVAACASPAAVITWTNTNGGYWSVADNWSPNTVPSTNDTAAITSPGTYTVLLNTSPVIAGFVLGGDGGAQTVTTAEQTLTLNGTGVIGVRGHFELSGVALAGTSQISLAGVMNWVWGSIHTNAAITVATNGQLNIGSGAQFSKVLYGSVTNAGTITWTPYGSLIIAGALHNRAGGLFDAQVNVALIKLGNSAQIVNDGVFRKSAGTGTLDCQVPLINNGTVETAEGTLTLADGSVFNSGCAFTGAGVTRMDSGTNTLNGFIHSENLHLNYSAVLAGTGGFSGTLTWGGGTIGSGAVITVATNGNLDIGSGAKFSKVLYGTLINAGTTTWKPTGNFVIGGALHNLLGGLFDAQVDVSLITFDDSALIVNDGVFRKSAGNGTLDCLVPIINNGTIETQTGTLELPGGSVLNAGSSFVGAGRTTMTTGTNSLNGTIHSENLVLSGATLVGAGSIYGSFTWSSGTIGTGLPLNIAAGSQLILSSGVNHAKFLNGGLTNAGTVIWRPVGTLLLGGVLHNLAGGVFDIQTDARLASNAPTAVILNDGLFRKSAATGNTTIEPRLINNGIVEAASGTLIFDDGYTHANGILSLAGGTVRSAQPLNLTGGWFTGWGDVTADVTNQAATVRPANSNGVLTISGKYTQLLGGNLELVLGGNSPGVNQSRLNITGPVRLSGSVSVRVAAGYMPNLGTEFSILSFASRTGDFAAYNGLFLLDQGRRLTPEYGPTSLTLLTVSAPQPPDVPVRLTVEDGVAVVAWPSEFEGCILYYTTNLNSVSWTLVPGVTNHYLNLPPLSPEKYFRVLKP